MKRRAFLQTLIAAWVGVKSFEELLVVEERVPVHVPFLMYKITEEMVEDELYGENYVILPRGYYKVAWTKQQDSSYL